MRLSIRFPFGFLLPVLLAFSVPLSGNVQEGRGEDIQFRGPVFAISRDDLGHVVQMTVQVNRSQQSVVLTEWTDVIRGRGFRATRDDVQLGDFVEVSGFFSTAARVVARTIHIESQDAIELQGIVEQVSGNLIRISGLDFLVDSSTRLHASGDLRSLEISAVSPGMRARVRGAEDGSLWAAREIEIGERTVESEPLRFSGTVTEMTGSLIMVDVGIRISNLPPVNAAVYRVPNTVVEGYLKVGAFVEVEGRFPPGDSAVLAIRIAVDSNRNGNVFDDSLNDGSESTVELVGVVQQLQRSGDGSAKSFYLNQTLVRLQSQTAVRFEEGSSVESRRLQEGQPVWVEGTWAQDRSVTASRIQIRMEDPDVGPGPGDPGSGDDPGPDDNPGPGDDLDPGNGGDGGPGESQPDVIELEGTITSVVRMQDDSVQRFEVDGRIVQVVAGTLIEDADSTPVPSGALEVGVQVKVKGVEQNDFVVAISVEIVG